MYIVVVHSHIQKEHVEKFRELTIQNAEASRSEKGCVRFDVLQQTDDPTRFTFIEMFKSKQDGASHLETNHFKKWREQALPLMAEGRTRFICHEVSLTEK